MGYSAYLRELLRPLGVYDLTDGSFSGGELEALGRALDDAADHLAGKQRESMVLTARDEGLTRMEQLFPGAATAESIRERRAAIAGFLQVGGDSFTAEALNRCLSACGTACVAAETETPGLVAVRFPDEAGEPENFEAKKRIVESLLPSHLQIRYDLHWSCWQQVEAAALTWQDAGAMTFYELAMLGLE